eukprot:scpid35845/ scgid1994/ Zinc finger ZZ-type and EF-hand domain-containing protein 1
MATAQNPVGDDMVEVWKNCFATPNLISGMNDGIIYDPDKSSAVCIGIDSEKKDTAGNTRHKEYAEEFGSLLSTAFKVEAKVDSFNEDDRESIIRTVEESAKEASDLLIFYLASHGGKGGIIQEQERVSLEQLANAMKSTKARVIVVILDLCNGGSVLPTFRDRLMECCPASNIYLLVATRENEKTWSCGKLGCSVFTFFLGNYLQRHAQVGRLPIWDAMDHAQTLTPVLSEFLSSNADGDSGVIPHPVMEAHGQDVHAESGEEKWVKRPYKAGDKLCLGKFPTYPTDDLTLPEDQRQWIDSLKPHLLTLHQHGYLTHNNTVLRCLLWHLFTELGRMWFEDLKPGFRRSLSEFESQQVTQHGLYEQWKEEAAMDLEEWFRDTKSSFGKAHFLLYEHPDRLLCDICEKDGGAARIRYCCLDCDDCVICEECWEGMTEKVCPKGDGEMHTFNEMGWTCDGCDMYICGTRLTCSACKDFDLCRSCHWVGRYPESHSKEHPMVPYYTIVGLSDVETVLPAVFIITLAEVLDIYESIPAVDDRQADPIKFKDVRQIGDAFISKIEPEFCDPFKTMQERVNRLFSRR